MWIFQYGSNLSSQRLNSRQRLGGAARVVGVARTIEPFRFTFPVWGGINGCAAAGILPGGEQPIWGVVYEIPQPWVVADPQNTRKTLDEIESEGQDYDRGPIELCWADGSGVDEKTQTYHPRQPRTDLKTDWHYVRHILLGAREHGLPVHYQRQLMAAMMENNPGLTEAIHAHFGQ